MISLQTGDCLKLINKLPDDHINATVTSPPYNKKKIGSTKKQVEKDYIPGVQSNGVMGKVVYDSFSDSLPEPLYQKQQVEILNAIYNKTKVGGSLFYNHKVRYLKGDSLSPWEWLTKTKWHIRQEIIWHRGCAPEISGYRFLHGEERIYWLVKGPKHPKLPRDLVNLGSIWKFGPDMKNPHPAPYPLRLPLTCIDAVLREPGVVLDPYSGSGTTGVAATLLGHDYIGFDLSDNYNDRAWDRIHNPSERDLSKFKEYQKLRN